MMERSEAINIYECFDQSGDPSHYVCWGHVDSERFRDECYKEFSVRPLLVQHKWQCTRKVLFKDHDKKKLRRRFDTVECSENLENAKAVTIGMAPKHDIDYIPREDEIN